MEILQRIINQDVPSYKTLRQALIDTDQEHVVYSFLPDITDTQQEPEIESTQA